MATLEAVEICAGAGGQALGLESAGFDHALAVELDENACNTLRENRPAWKVAQGDVADGSVWNPADYKGVALLAGGVPCPPFSIAGKQLGSADERDLFAWAVELVDVVRPRALLLENVRGLSMPRFAGYRQHVLDRLAELGYVAEWQLLQASDYGVPQLRPRFVLVALQPEDAPYFSWPAKLSQAPTVGEALVDLMASQGWRGARRWANRADGIAPTIVGGSKKHGGADLGPTRAKRAWAALGTDAHGVADRPPQPGDSFEIGPRLTTEMVARVQGWTDAYPWAFTGRKTTRYRQVGNAFPPPVAAAVGTSIAQALNQVGKPVERSVSEHDPIYRALRENGEYMTAAQIARAMGKVIDTPELERRISLLSRDFDIDIAEESRGVAYKLGRFRGFLGQQDHTRNEQFLKYRAQVS